MTTQTRPTRRPTAGAVPWALATGVAGVAANVLLVLFFLLARPFDGAVNAFSWLGTANDVVVIVQFLTFIPVALALRARLRPTRPVRVATVVGVAAMATVTVLQVLLVTGTLDFDRQVVAVCVAFLGVYGWVLAVASTGHQDGSLPRPVTRFGLLVGAAYPLGLLVAAPAALLFPWGSPAQLALAVPAVVVGSVGWLGLPVWPLLLARSVFTPEEAS